MWTIGALYSDLVFSDGNFYVGNEGDDYSNIYDGVGVGATEQTIGTANNFNLSP